MPKRVCVLEVGSNSLKFLALDLESREVYFDEMYVTQIGKDLEKTGLISQEKIRETISLIGRCLFNLPEKRTWKIFVIGTMWLRNAKNKIDFDRLLFQEYDLAIRVINAKEEATFAFLGAYYSLRLENTRAMTIDIGGGSSELILSEGKQITKIQSFDLGALNGTEKFLSFESVSKEQCTDLQSYFHRFLQQKFFQPEKQDCLIGVGGTITTLGLMIYDEPLENLQGKVITLSQLQEKIELLQSYTSSERRQIRGMDVKRADIILAGVLILSSIMEYFTYTELRICLHGVRYGFVSEWE